jgi:hypothetical protein
VSAKNKLEEHTTIYNINDVPHTITHGNHGRMRLSIDVDDHESNHTAGTKNWYVEVPAYAHAYVNVKNGKSLNYRIKNNYF